jgi:hypothetical protein
LDEKDGIFILRDQISVLTGNCSGSSIHVEPDSRVDLLLGFGAFGDHLLCWWLLLMVILVGVSFLSVELRLIVLFQLVEFQGKRLKFHSLHPIRIRMRITAIRFPREKSLNSKVRKNLPLESLESSNNKAKPQVENLDNSSFSDNQAILSF